MLPVQGSNLAVKPAKLHPAKDICTRKQLREMLGMSNLTGKGYDVIEECLSRDCLYYAINRTPTADVDASLRPIYSES
jgi:hypothetical protein